MKPLNNPIRIFLFLFSCLFLNNQVIASHLMGGEIKWEHLNGDKYKITVYAYRDCNGWQMSNADINLRGNCSGITTSSQTMSPGRDVTPVCPGQCTSCKSKTCSFKYGMEQYELTRTIDVSQFKKNGCCDLTISWTLSSRNGAISTGAANQNFYVEGKMNVCQTIPDNSPLFNPNPYTIICLGRDYTTNVGDNDPDTNSSGSKLDSLVYSFTSPMQSAGTKTSWNSPYSHQKPLSYLGFPKHYPIFRFPFGIHLDSNTGKLAFRPMKLEQTVMAIKIEEYRNGKKIGETTRDIQIIVIKCPNNNPPILSGAKCGKPTIDNFELKACPGQEICFDICTSDKDRDDTVQINWNSGIPDAKFKVLNKGDKMEVGRFCWTPTQADIGSKAHTFVVNAWDNACPTYGKISQIFRIFVAAADTFDIQSKMSVGSNLCGEMKLTAKTKDGKPNTEWDWYLDSTLIRSRNHYQIGDIFYYNFSHNGVYPIKITSARASCHIAFYDTLKITHLKPIALTNIADTTICWPLKIAKTFSGSGGYGSLKYSWRGGISDTTNLIKDHFSKATNHSGYSKTITYRATDTAGCFTDSAFSVWVKYNYFPKVELDTVICGDVVTKALKLSNDSITQPGNWTGPGVTNNTFSSKGLSHGRYVLNYYSEDSTGCAIDSAIIDILSRPKIDAGKDLNACPTMAQDILLSGTPSGGTWFGDNVLSNGRFASSTNNIGYNKVFYKYTDLSGCTSLDSLEINVLNYQIIADAGVDTQVCINDSNFALLGTPNNGHWSGSHVLFKNGKYTFQGHIPDADQEFKLSYAVVDSIGCYGGDSKILTTRTVPKVVTTDIIHCFYGGLDTIYLKATPSGGIWKGKGIFGSSGEIILDHSYIGEQKYTYEASNQYGCSSFDKLLLNVREKPVVTAGSDDTLCLNANRNYTFKPNVFGGLWSGPGLSTNNGNSVVLNNNFNGVNHYTYSYTDAYGCSGSDDLNLYVGNLNNAAFIPSKTTGMSPVTIDFNNQSTNGDFYYWNFGNGLTSQAFEPSTTYTQEGQYEVTLLAIDSLGYCQTKASKTINVEHNTGTEAITEQLFQVYPNPASSHLNVENNTGQSFTFTILNSLGQHVQDYQVQSQEQINLSNIPSGVYSYNISQLGKSYTGMIIIQ